MGRKAATTRPAQVLTPWLNQDLTLYHGTIDRWTSSILAAVDVTRGRSITDFGRGFYTTTLLIQGEQWARRMSRSKPGTKPVVIQFTMKRDLLAGLQAIWFVRGDSQADDFWSLVSHCRNGNPEHARGMVNGWYDVAIGPLAASWERRECFQDADQISFHTSAAATLLNASPRIALNVPP